MRLLLAFLTLIFFLGCAQTVGDLEEEVIAIHDEVMPETGTIHRLTKDLAKAARDTLLSEAQRVKIKNNMQNLGRAEAAMMTWMAEYKAPKADTPKEEAFAILEKEKVKIITVRDKMRSSIEEAKTLLEELK